MNAYCLKLYKVSFSHFISRVFSYLQQLAYRQSQQLRTLQYNSTIQFNFCKNFLLHRNMTIKYKYIRLKWVFLIFLSILMARPTLAMIATHIKCRDGFYPRSNVRRFPVPDEKVSWLVEYKNYKPANHTAATIHGKPWADPDIGENNFKPNWNAIDGDVSRISYMGQYKIENGYPLNPLGRTGIAGRGVLGRWGPNHAADPVVTRWKRLETGAIARDEYNRPILQFVAIKRGDTGEWALPGGMVDPGEKVTVTAVREFQEEAVNSFDMSEEQKQDWDRRFNKFFSGGTVVYEGYIDDPRNTDNSWMESVANSFHDDTGATVGALNLNAGDDAVGVQWVDITPQLKLYASHKEMVNEVYRKITNSTK